MMRTSSSSLMLGRCGAVGLHLLQFGLELVNPFLQCRQSVRHGANLGAGTEHHAKPNFAGQCPTFRPSAHMLSPSHDPVVDMSSSPVLIQNSLHRSPPPLVERGLQSALQFAAGVPSIEVRVRGAVAGLYVAGRLAVEIIEHADFVRRALQQRPFEPLADAEKLGPPAAALLFPPLAV